MKNSVFIKGVNEVNEDDLPIGKRPIELSASCEGPITTIEITSKGLLNETYRLNTEDFIYMLQNISKEVKVTYRKFEDSKLKAKEKKDLLVNLKEQDEIILADEVDPREEYYSLRNNEVENENEIDGESRQ